MKMLYAGVDYSMTCPAITVGASKDFNKAFKFFYNDTKKYHGSFKPNIIGMPILEYENSQERYDNISEWAMTIFKKFGVQYVCLEDYSLGSKGQVFNIAENGGLLKHKMWKAGIQFVTPSPNTIKKHFSEKGNAKKLEMYETFMKKTGVDLAGILDGNPEKNPISDIVDSYAMLCYAIDEF